MHDEVKVEILHATHAVASSIALNIHFFSEIGLPSGRHPFPAQLFQFYLQSPSSGLGSEQ